MKFAAPVTLSLLLTACSGGADRSAATEATNLQVVYNGPDIAAAVAKLPDGQLRGVLFRAVRDAGLPCQDVTQIQRFPDERGVKNWRVECDGRSQQLVEIRKDGNANVLSRPQR